MLLSFFLILSLGRRWITPFWFLLVLIICSRCFCPESLSSLKSVLKRHSNSCSSSSIHFCRIDGFDCFLFLAAGGLNSSSSSSSSLYACCSSCNRSGTGMKFSSMCSGVDFKFLVCSCNCVDVPCCITGSCSFSTISVKKRKSINSLSHKDGFNNSLYMQFFFF